MPNIYLTINQHNKDNGILPWRYIGSDQFDNDAYFGSSVGLLEDIALLGTDKFVKLILESISDIPNKELRFKEATYLKKHNVKHDPTYYNLTDAYAPAGGKKGMKHSKKFVRSQNWIDSRTGNKWTPEQRANRAGEGNPMFGKLASAETKKKMSQQRAGGNNANALDWEVTDPTGNTIKIKGLRAWCHENNLPYNRIYASKDGWCAIKHGSGKGGRKNER